MTLEPVEPSQPGRREEGQPPRELTPIERLYEQMDTRLLREQITAALDADDVDLPLLLQVGTLRTPQLLLSSDKRALGHEFFLPVQKAFLRKHKPKGIALFPGAQTTVVLSDKEVKIGIGTIGGPDFDWSAGRELLFRIDAIGELARTWIHDEDERPFHLRAAYDLATQVVGAIQRESWRVLARGERSPGEAFHAELEVLIPEITRREQVLAQAAEQSAETQYARGMLWGGLAVVVVSIVAGLGLYLSGLEAIIGIALPAGALGAVVSVLQRMHSGSLQLDVNATAERLRMFGAIRPFIGGVFGMLLYAILEAGQLPAIQVPESVGAGIAFVTLLGFLAGFNERFAQDMLTGSTLPMSTHISQ